MSNANSEKVQKPKKLIVCCDGTWMDSDNGYVKGSWGQPGHLQTPTNVTRLARAIKPEDRDHHPQIVYYQAGIGTGIGVWNHLIGGGTGAGFSENVREAYAFLANNYWHGEDKIAPGDSIFLNGFSRGAYTARSLAGVISQLGLLRKQHIEWFYDIFHDWQNAGNPRRPPKFFKNYYEAYPPSKDDLKSMVHAPSTNQDVTSYLDEYRNNLLVMEITREVNIKAIGVWDTVGALGVPVNPLLQKVLNLPAFIHNYKWVDTRLDQHNHIENAFQALALDERRAPYSPAIWEKPEGCTTNLKQCWFAGAHSNVGGSYRDNSTANVTLAWMMDQLSGDEIHETDPAAWNSADWIDFDEDYLPKQYQRNKRYLSSIDQHRTWGLGTIYDSLTFPQELAGVKPRTPGRAHPRIYHNDSVDESRFLRETNEHIHASVRARMDLGGRSFEQDPEASLFNKIKFGIRSFIRGFIHKLRGRESHMLYLPQKYGPLAGWALKDGHEYHDDHPVNGVDPVQGYEDRPYWEWKEDADLPVEKRRVMKEDRLGTFEQMLLSHYGKEVADPVFKTNVGSRRVVHLKERKKSVVGYLKAKTF